MPSANKVLFEMQFQKYQELPVHQKRRVEFLAEDMAKERGYESLKEVKEKRPYLYKQFIADAMVKLGF